MAVPRSVVPDPARHASVACFANPTSSVASEAGHCVDPSTACALVLSTSFASATIALVLAELESPGPASVLLLQRLADVLVVQAMRWLTKQRGCLAQRQQQPGLVALSDPPVHKALSLMHAQVGHAWTVAELAAKVGLSRSGFAARFTELVGEPPLQYLARWRVTRAARSFVTRTSR